MKILFLGDTHGEFMSCVRAIDFAEEFDIDSIVQVGDFGYWPSTRKGYEFLEGVRGYLGDTEIDFYWIAGNHEDHNTLDAILGGDPTNEPFIAHGGLVHIRSGARWEWDGVTFGALGGGYSIDRAHRTRESPSYGWFPQEVPDASLIPGIGKVDVLITHDSPIIPPPMLASGRFFSIPESQDCQRTVYAALTSAQPSVLVHGHWHVKYRSGVAGTEVWGLDCNSLRHSACVYDTSVRKMCSVQEWEMTHEHE